MPRLKDVTPKRSKPAKSQLYVDSQLAKLIRRVASAERRELSPLIEDMFVLYLRTEHPDWELDFADDDEATSSKPSTSERRSGERRGAGYKGTGKPIPGADKPGINRRKGGERRKKSTAKKKR